MSDLQNLLRLRNVEKRYGTRKVLQIEELEISTGDHILLTGANGSGKSTLVRVLAGITTIDRGWINRAPPLERMVLGYVPQTGGLYGDMTLRQNLEIYSRMYATQPARSTDDVWFVRDTSLASFIDVQIGDMSGGIRRLAAFACVLSAGPHALLLDEPSSELDDRHAQQIYDVLELTHETMAFTVISTHEARPPRFLNRNVTMADGRIAEPTS